MSDSELLLALGPEELATGIMPDLPGANPRLWASGQNALFADGGVQPFPGFQRVVQGAHGPVMGLIDSQPGGVPTAYWGTEDRLWSWSETDFGPVVRGGLYTGGHLWSLERWGEWIIATNGSHVMQVMKTTSFGNLAGTPPLAKIIVRRSPYLIGLNTDLGGEYYEWCTADDVEVWTPSATNSAGSKAIRDLSSEIRAAEPFRGEVIAATANELVLIRYVGHPFIFGDTVTVQGVGVFGKYSMCVGQDMLYGMGPRGIWKSDGNGHQYFDDPIIRELVYDDINLEAAHRSVAWFDRLNSLAIFWYPSVGVSFPDQAVAMDVRTNAWTRLSYGRTAVADSGVFEYALSGDSNGHLYSQGMKSPVAAEPNPRGYLELDPTAQIRLNGGAWEEVRG